MGKIQINIELRPWKLNKIVTISEPQRIISFGFTVFTKYNNNDIFLKYSLVDTLCFIH
jgi:hypothetical protein